MSNAETFQAGITAAKSGDLVRAAALFAQVVQADPRSELGWLWLGFCCTTPEQREYCFRRVLKLNPNNLEAKSQLESLTGSPPKPPAWASTSPADILKEPGEPPPVQKAGAPKVHLSDKPIVQPFSSETPRPQKPFTPIASPAPAPPTMREAILAPEEKLPSPPAVKAAAIVDRSKAIGPNRKKPNNILVVLMGLWQP